MGDNARVYGYARVSSREQNLDRQLEALRNYGVAERDIITDKASGKTFERTGYQSLVNTLLRKGDTLVIHSLDRLGRSYADMQSEWHRIVDEIGADIVVLDMPLINTVQSDDNLDKKFVADLVLQILSYVAERERQSIKERQRQGIAIAKEQGKKLGRPKAEFPEGWNEVYTKWKNKELTAVQSYTALGIKKTTFYNFVNRYEASTKFQS